MIDKYIPEIRKLLKKEYVYLTSTHGINAPPDLLLDRALEYFVKYVNRQFTSKLKTDIYNKLESSEYMTVKELVEFLNYTETHIRQTLRGIKGVYISRIGNIRYYSIYPEKLPKIDHAEPLLLKYIHDHIEVSLDDMYLHLEKKLNKYQIKQILKKHVDSGKLRTFKRSPSGRGNWTTMYTEA